MGCCLLVADSMKILSEVKRRFLGGHLVFGLADTLPKVLNGGALILAGIYAPHELFSQLIIFEVLLGITILFASAGGDKTLERYGGVLDRKELLELLASIAKMGLVTVSCLSILFFSLSHYLQTTDSWIRLFNNQNPLAILSVGCLAAYFAFLVSVTYSRLNTKLLFQLRLVQSAAAAIAIFITIKWSFSDVAAVRLCVATPLLLYAALRAARVILSEGGGSAQASRANTPSPSQVKKYSLAFLLTGLLSFLASNVDKLLLAPLLTDKQFATIALSQRVLVIYTLALSVVLATVPSKLYMSEQPDHLAIKTISGILLLMLPISIFFIALLALFFATLEPDYDLSHLILMCGVYGAAATFSAAVSFQTAIILLRRGQSIINMMTATSSLFLHCALLYFLVPVLSVWGGAVATCLVNMALYYVQGLLSGIRSDDRIPVLVSALLMMAIGALAAKMFAWQLSITYFVALLGVMGLAASFFGHNAFRKSLDSLSAFK